MASATTWRSPLSILMGARRNDDADLELREDYFRPQLTPAAAVAAPRTPPQEKVKPSPSSSSGLAAYNPFSYFGLKSPAPVLAAAEGRSETAAGDNGNETENGSPAPPLGAFPPPISAESPTGRDEGDHRGDDDSVDEREERGDDHQYVASHPWFNQLALTESNNPYHNHSNNQPNDRPNDFVESRAIKKFLTWSDQKSIIGTTFNFANSIIGAGAMGLGGAFAASGGGISIICLIGFAFLTKSSLDLVVDLSSCPSVISKARSQDKDSSGNDRGNDVALGSSFADSESFSEEPESDGLSAMIAEVGEYNTSNIINEVADGSNNGGDDQSNQGDSPPNNETANDAKVLEEESPDDESPEKATNNDSSPLMAPEEGQNENDELGDMVLTPTKTRGLGIDHPLQSPELLNERDRYDSLTMDVAQPKYFSPLQLNTDGIPVVKSIKSTPSFQIDTPVQQNQGTMTPCTYEELGRVAYGTTGRLSVLVSKALYSFGCLVAYVVVVRDNFGLALRQIIVGPNSPNFVEGNEGGWLYDDDFLAFWISAIFMLPLSCPRTMKPLAKFSFISIMSIIFLIIAVIYLFFTCTNPNAAGKSSFYENWIEIRSFSGFIESLGCFIFTFVCHHTVNLAYESLPPPIRNPKIWRRVSTNSIALALEASLAIGVFAYLTFGSQTPTDVLMGYPADLTLVNIARLLLCLTMVLTFPLPLLTCREMSILICIDMHKFYHIHDMGRFNIFHSLSWGDFMVFISTYICRGSQKQTMHNGVDSNGAEEQEEFVHMQRLSFFQRLSFKREGYRNTDVGFDDTNDEWLDELDGGGDPTTQALLSEEERESALITSIGGQKGKEIIPSPLSSRSGDESSSETTIYPIEIPTPSWILPNGDDRQLSLLWHATFTFTIWLIVTICAIKSPSLGDVLDLVGAFTGTMLAFVLPALFSFKLRGYSHLSLAILGIGGVVGLLGTIFSLFKFTRDVT